MSAILCEHFLTLGCEFVITGLQARPELNGFLATVVGALEDGRVPAEVRNTARNSVRLRLPNMRPLGCSGPRSTTSGHAVRTVDQPQGGCYVHTVGVCGGSVMQPALEIHGRELFVRDVPNCKSASVARLVNFLVSRMEDGHPILEPQYVQCSGLQMEVAVHPPAPARDLSEAYHLQLPNGNELIELIPLMPVQPADTDEMWSRVPMPAEQANLPGMGAVKKLESYQLGGPQLLPHQGDILSSEVGIAAEEGDEATVSAYLEAGGYVNARFPTEAGAMTLLMLAARAGQTALVVLLLARGAEPNLRHACFGTALMAAAEMGNTAIIKQLLRAGAIPKLLDADGRTARDFAKDKKTVVALRRG